MHLSNIPTSTGHDLRISVLGITKTRIEDEEVELLVERLAFVKISVVDTSRKRHSRYSKYREFVFSFTVGGVPCAPEGKERMALGKEGCDLVDMWMLEHWALFKSAFKKFTSSKFNAVTNAPSKYVAPE